MSFIALTDAVWSRPIYVRPGVIAGITERTSTETLVWTLCDSEPYVVKETPERVRSMVIEAENVARGKDPW